MQRFDIQADAAYWTRGWEKPRRFQWHGGVEGIARMRRLLESGAHEVFLFNGVSPDGLPAALKQDLLARVARGKGLVLVGVKPRGRWDPPLENDPDRVALDEPLILDAPLARRAETGDPRIRENATTGELRTAVRHRSGGLRLCSVSPDPATQWFAHSDKWAHTNGFLCQFYWKELIK